MTTAPSRAARAFARKLLPRAAEADHVDQRARRAPPRVAVGQTEVGAGPPARRRLLGRRHLRRVEQEALHLAPHVGPVALVEVQHQRKRAVAGHLQVEAHQLVGHGGPAAEVQVHRQEGQVGGHVRVAKALVELDAIEDADAVLEADGVRPQVAVAVADAALAHPRLEQVPLLGEEALHVLAGLLEPASGDGAADIGLRLLEVLAPVAGDDRPGRRRPRSPAPSPPRRGTRRAAAPGRAPSRR